jgi:hypothetical protein
MSYLRKSRIITTLAVGVFLTVAMAWGKPLPKPPEAPARAEIARWDVLSQFLRWAAQWSSKNGPSVDPNGNPIPQTGQAGGWDSKVPVCPADSFGCGM